MKFMLTISLGITLAFSSALAAPPNPFAKQEEIAELKKIAKYLQNLGEYFGYDLSSFCKTGGACDALGKSPYVNTLTDKSTTYATELNLYYTFVGALLGGTQNTTAPNPIVPRTIASNPDLSNYGILNALAGRSYTQQPYSTASANTVSVVPFVDQRTYQSDPVSQAILNILATPNDTFCAGESTVKCPYLTRETILKDVIGPLPITEKVFTSESNQSLVPQLNIDTLLSPLMYTTSSGSQGNASPGSSGTGSPNAGPPSSKNGLTATMQAQQAENFIRYATGGLDPMSLPDLQDYNQLLSTALNTIDNSAQLIK